MSRLYSILVVSLLLTSLLASIVFGNSVSIATGVPSRDDILGLWMELDS